MSSLHIHVHLHAHYWKKLSKGVADMHVTIMCTGMGLSSGGMLFVCLHACARVHKHARVD
jgi:hypothetical protein